MHNIILYFSVNVKWGKEKYSGLDLSTDESPEIFRLQLYSLTNVLPERQKVMLKGITVKNDWDNLKLKNVIKTLIITAFHVMQNFYLPMKIRIFLKIVYG